ncbi:amidohydrolase family protein [Mangrovicoccus ximenensis]|uniref:amidohydrolase family protein n=1 Tax=Mangrovicoccus ximenensis TaxID=1911570 RepID=UPI000D3D58B4|nr:amidohydrolase family protein [Mangrovicoccus ximenensis]
MPALHITGAADPLTGREISVAIANGVLVPAPAAGSREIDGRGMFLMPGLIDSHLHLLTGGVALGQLNLLEINGEDAFRAALAAYAEGRDSDPVLCGWSATYGIFGPGTRPDRHRLDRVSPDRPLMITSVDWHCAWANTAALRLAGLMETVPDVPGVILGDDGLPNGELQEFEAMGLVQRHASSGGREGLGLIGREPPAADAAERPVRAGTGHAKGPPRHPRDNLRRAAGPGLAVIAARARRRQRGVSPSCPRRIRRSSPGTPPCGRR